jgi:hypothetical protein
MIAKPEGAIDNPATLKGKVIVDPEPEKTSDLHFESISSKPEDLSAQMEEGSDHHRLFTRIDKSFDRMEKSFDQIDKSLDRISTELNRMYTEMDKRFTRYALWFVFLTIAFAPHPCRHDCK